MAKPCFYYPELTRMSQAGDVVELSPAESAHALQSRRLGVGTSIDLINGTGVLASAKISEVRKRQVFVEIEKILETEIDRPKLNFAVAMPKGDRQKVLVDMLTQLGATSLTPMISEYAVSVPKPNQLDKLRRVSIESCKQSHNPAALDIRAPLSFEELCQNDAHKVYADIDGLSSTEAKETVLSHDEVLIMIGPEGGFCEREITALKGCGATCIRLADYILRTETAAIAVAAIFAG